MGKAETVQPTDKLVSVPGAFAGQYDWLGVMKSNLKTEAAEAERAARAKQKVDGSADELAREYLRLTDREAKLKEELTAVREGLKDLWAQQGLAKAEGITISPAIELRLASDAVLAELPPLLAGAVIRYEPVFSVEAFLYLANAGAVSQDLVRKHLRGKFDIQVKRVTTATATATAGR